MQNIDLFQPPDKQAKCALLRECFNLTDGDVRYGGARFDEFIAYYTKQLQLLRFQYGPGGKIWLLPFGSHAQLLEVLRLIKAHPGRTRAEARRQLQSQCPWSCNSPDKYLDAAVDVCLRIWLMINFRPADEAGVGGGRPCIEWRNDTPLALLLEDLFPKSTTDLTLTQRRLKSNFTAACMVNVCGLKVRWTVSLEDHLRLDRQQKVLWVMPHREYLWEQSQAAKGSNMPLPPELFAEASKTLDLLFPAWDKATRQFLEREGKNFHIVSPGYRELDLKHFSFFRERLLELNEDIYLAAAEDWWQLWRDRRDPQKFWTFWIALMILILTVIATVASIVQAWASLKALKDS